MSDTIQIKVMPNGEQSFQGMSPLGQVLIALDVWAKLTPNQREIVAACRVKRSRSKDFYKKWCVHAAVSALPRTIASLERKGVVAKGHLTEIGIYAALWQGGKRS